MSEATTPVQEQKAYTVPTALEKDSPSEKSNDPIDMKEAKQQLIDKLKNHADSAEQAVRAKSEEVDALLTNAINKKAENLPESQRERVQQLMDQIDQQKLPQESAELLAEKVARSSKGFVASQVKEGYKHALHAINIDAAKLPDDMKHVIGKNPNRVTNKEVVEFLLNQQDATLRHFLERNGVTENIADIQASIRTTLSADLQKTAEQYPENSFIQLSIAKHNKRLGITPPESSPPPDNEAAVLSVPQDAAAEPENQRIPAADGGAGLEAYEKSSDNATKNSIRVATEQATHTANVVETPPAPEQIAEPSSETTADDTSTVNNAEPAQPEAILPPAETPPSPTEAVAPANDASADTPPVADEQKGTLDAVLETIPKEHLVYYLDTIKNADINQLQSMEVQYKKLTQEKEEAVKRDNEIRAALQAEKAYFDQDAGFSFNPLKLYKNYQQGRELERNYDAVSAQMKEKYGPRYRDTVGKQAEQIDRIPVDSSKRTFFYKDFSELLSVPHVKALFNEIAVTQQENPVQPDTVTKIKAMQENLTSLLESLKPPVELHPQPQSDADQLQAA